MISVVLPVLNSEKTEWTERILARLLEVEGLEVVRGSGETRAQRLQSGIEASKGSTILLHHPRSLVAREGLEWLRDHENEVGWGGFTHAFDREHYLLRFTSWYSNRVRPRRGILYLDHCIFFRRELLTRPIPPVAIFEDTELSRILRESGPPRVLPFVSETSAIRFAKNGVWRQALMNQRLKWEYWFGRSDAKMNDRYERGLRLNG
jgi:hypothetical protein